MLKQKPKEECFLPLAFSYLLSYISAVVQVLWPEDDTAHNGRGLPTSVSNQESAPLTNLMHEIPQLRFPLPENA